MYFKNTSESCTRLKIVKNICIGYGFKLLSHILAEYAITTTNMIGSTAVFFDDSWYYNTYGKITAINLWIYSDVNSFSGYVTFIMLYEYLCVFAYAYLCLRVHICMYVCVCVCLSVSVYAPVSV